MLQDPTAWKDDLAFYMSEEDVADQVSAIDPLLQTGSKAATAAWVGIAGTLGGAFGAITISPAVRRPLLFAAYLVVAAVLLRRVYPLTVRLLGKGAGWLAMFAFFWTSLLGLSVVFVAGIESRWLAYGLGIGAGAFIGMMYGAFPPDVARKDNPWMLAFLVAPVGAFAGVYFLRHGGMPGTIAGVAAAGAIAAGLLMAPMSVLLVKLWDEAQSLADLGLLYLHNDTFAPKAVAYLDRAIALDPQKAQVLQLARGRPGPDARARTGNGRLGHGVQVGAKGSGTARPARRRSTAARQPRRRDSRIRVRARERSQSCQGSCLSWRRVGAASGSDTRLRPLRSRDCPCASRRESPLRSQLRLRPER